MRRDFDADVSLAKKQRLAIAHIDVEQAFIDGNGRVARLHSHLVFHALGLATGLWSPMRGLARTHEQYCARLNNADLPRRNDLGGRGRLSQEKLVAFARYFLDVCLDQVRFMQERLGFATLKDRVRALLLHLQQRPWQIGSEKSVIKIEALEALHYVAMVGPIERSRFGPLPSRWAHLRCIDPALPAARPSRPAGRCARVPSR